MLSKIFTSTIHGIEAKVVKVETDIARGLPALNMVGMADVAVRESAERIRSAINNSGFDYPMGRITVNMAPANIRKRGSHLDLPIAIGILMSSGCIFDGSAGEYCLFGELSLDGQLNRVGGVLPMVDAAKKAGIKKIVLPGENVEEAALIPDITLFPAKNLRQIVRHFNMEQKIAAYDNQTAVEEGYTSPEGTLDFVDVRGQENAKRAITVAVAGGHGLMMMGSPSTGKTMLAMRIPTIMPPMSAEEIADVTRIYSVAGLLNSSRPYVKQRPFRQPHHKITPAGLLGGGIYPLPGEISLAHEGVLFLDEIGEFNARLIDTLREPLELGRISIIRHGENFIFPSAFMLVGASNPCKCGYYGDTEHTCTCTELEVRKYQNRLSGPISDRIDMHIRLTPVPYNELKTATSLSSKEMSEAIKSAREIAKQRYKGLPITINSRLDDHLISRFCPMTNHGKQLLSMAYEKMKLNPRTLAKVYRVSRTIADLDAKDIIEEKHIAEALQYREEVIRR